MSSDEKTEPFLLLNEVQQPPRPGPTMAAILQKLERVEELSGQVLKRQQQTALMVDGFASATHRRFDVLHEEAALLRVSVLRPDNDTDQVPVTVDVAPTPNNAKAKAVVVFTGKLLSYATTIAIGLRLVGKQFPEYEAAIDGVLGLFGL